MRNLLLTIVVTVMIWSTTHDLRTIAQDLEPTEETAPGFNYQHWYEQTRDLERPVQRVYGDPHSIGRCPRCNGSTDPYGADTYGSLGIGCTCEAKTPPPSKTLKFNTSKHQRLNIDTSNVKGHDAKHKACQCGGDCKCPPLVCEAGDCLHNYAVVFGTPTSQHTQAMWEVINDLRKQGYILYYIDVSKYLTVIKQFTLTVDPVTMVMNDGEIIVEWQGAVSKQVLSKHMQTRTEQGQRRKPNASDQRW